MKQRSAFCGSGKQPCVQDLHSAEQTTVVALVHAMAGLWMAYSQHSVALKQADRYFLHCPLPML